MRCCLAMVFFLVLLPAIPQAEGPPELITRLLQLPIPDRVELCGEQIPLKREDVLERLDLELVITIGSPLRTALWLKRIPRYFPHIEREIRNRGLPEDLKYVALVESDLRADVTSRAGAVGPWQFIRSTGSLYGLDRTSWKDERRDWDESTRAALQHLSDLKEFLGSWPLALAAYNSGKHRVLRAMENQGQNDFFGLRLPRETERYVFRVIAAKLVVENPEAYGIRIENARLYAPLETVELWIDVPRPRLPAVAVARAAGISYRHLMSLNPWLKGQYLPKGSRRVTVPACAESGFRAALAQWERENPEPKTVYYRVRKGDTLSAIAREHSVRLSDLCSWNGLTTRSIIRPGQELMVQAVD